MRRVGELSGAAALLIAAVGFQNTARAEEVMEEVVVQGRLQNSAEKVINERINDEVVTDLIGAEMIGRIGDTTVAAALRRVSGLSLVNDKFIYVRGLGERYSSTTLNGAYIPSPDLSRNVIPLDIFPTSIVESIAVQKSYSADKAASFGGGNIDIRTKGIPDSLTYSIEVGSGMNTEVDNVLSYAGGGDDRWGKDDGTRALSTSLLSSIQRFVGQIDAQSILTGLQKEGNTTATIQDGRALNRQLALNLNRNVSVVPGSDRPDLNVKGNLGDNFYLNDDWELGFSVGGSYASKWRQADSYAANFGFPDERFERERKSTESIDINGNMNLGLRFTDDHLISTTSLYIRNTDDQASIRDYFNENRQKSDGRGFREEGVKFEQRSMIVNQIKGEHSIGSSTREVLSFLPLDWIPEEGKVTWQYSKARASTSIPNEVDVRYDTTTDLNTAEVLTSSVTISNSAANYLFTDLNDEVIDYGWQFIWPITTASSTIEISGGTARSQKVRRYAQSQFTLGPLSVANPATLAGGIADVFSDANITSAANNFAFALAGTNNQSYIAATVVDAGFGKVDWIYNEKWRASAGVRWEAYRQVALDWNLYGYTIASPQISVDPLVLEKAVYQKDEYYPAVALTYMSDDFWAEMFQLRFGYSKTVVRPDLREITDASYVDARTGYVTDGNPGVIPSELSNYDLRGEWFFDSGDNLTLSLFYKDIKNPIEFFEVAASDTNRAREILNAESGFVGGMEIEGLKSLEFLGGIGDAFFLQGNMTIQDSEITAGPLADAPTNSVRKLAGASDYVVNLLLGFDSYDGKHAATLVYNIFGERLYSAGRGGSPDLFEQPFNSLDVTYSWYATDSMTLKLKVQNLLNQEVTINQDAIEVFREKPGINLSMSFAWAL